MGLNVPFKFVSDQWSITNYNRSMLNDFPKIMRYSQEALSRTFPEKEFFLYQMGFLSYKFGKYKRALGLFRAILRMDPQNADALHYLGLCLKALGQEEAGEQLWAYQ